MSVKHPFLRISQLHKGYDANRIAGMVEGVVGGAALVSAAMETVLELDLPCQCNVFVVKNVIDSCLGYPIDIKQTAWWGEEVICK